MKNPNSYVNRVKRYFKARWSAEDFPGAEPRFQLTLFAKDLFIFVGFPIAAVFIFKTCEIVMSGPGRSPSSQKSSNGPISGEPSRSQIISFYPTSVGSTGRIKKQAPGTLVRVRLMNVVETFSNAPVHAQIVDGGLGQAFLGSTLIGDAVSNSNINRIEIMFRYVRDIRRTGVAVPISARALSLNGTLGLEAKKKEGFFARAALNSSGSVGQDGHSGSGDSDIKSIIAKALTAGLVQEFGSESQVEKNRAQVLTLQPPTEFFVELTDFFPGTGR